MTTSAPRHSPWFSLLREEHGFSGAQKALAILLALGLILMVTRSITGGTTVASVNSKAMLDEQDGNAAVVWSEQGGGGSLSGPSGSGTAVGGSDSNGSAGDGDSGGGFWSTVGHVVLGVGTVVGIFVAPEIVIPLMIADGILYTAEGDYVSAGISFLAPAAAGIKIIQGGIKVVQGGEEVVKIIQTGEEIVQSVNAERKVIQEAIELERAGLPSELIKRLSSAELAEAEGALSKWSVNAAGKNQGVVHILDYAEGAGGLGKVNRLEKLAEYTGRGPFNPASADVLQSVTKTLDELVAEAALQSSKGAGTVRTVGDKVISFVAKDGALPPFSQGQKGIIIIQQDGKFSTFFNGAWKAFGKLE